MTTTAGSQSADATTRMRTAHRHARTLHDVRTDPGQDEVWGWCGRTLSQAVTSATGRAWLRTAAIPAQRTDTTFFTGAAEAETHIPRTVPRPRLRAYHDFADTGWRYRAELYDYLHVGPPTRRMVLTTPLTLSAPWWTSLRAALDTITTVTTSRYTTRQEYLDWAMPRFLGTPVDTAAPSWSTAHGDLHFANLCTPRLHILDWEGFGMAPTGYDAAMLHTTSLLVPGVAAQIRTELAHQLDAPAGRFAELAVITELLHGTNRGTNLDLADALHRRATDLLGHPVPPRRRNRTPYQRGELDTFGSLREP